MDSALLNFLEKAASGFQKPLTCCCRTAPIPMPEASVEIEITASGSGNQSGEVSIRAC